MFESFKFLVKEELKIIESIYNKLDVFLDNYELFRSINNYLYSPLKDGYYIAFCSENEVCLKSKKSKNDMFHLLVTPSLRHIETISMKVISYNGRLEEEIIAQFSSDDRVIVTKKEIEKIVQGKKQEVISIKDRTTVKSYVDKALRYDYDYGTETCFRLNQNYSKSSLSETFIDSNQKAVKRKAIIAEDDFQKDPATITYYETDHYEAPPFDDRYSNDTYKYHMSITTKEKFNEFVNGQNDVVILKR